MAKEYEQPPTIAQLININCKLGKTIRQLKAELAGKAFDVKTFRSLVNLRNTELAAKDKRIEELEADLRKYSDHLPACQMSWDEELSDNCTCGLRQALTKGKGGK